MNPLNRPLAALCRHFALFYRGETNDAWFEAWSVVAQGLGVVNAPLDPKALAQSEAKLFYGVGERTYPMTESNWSNDAGLYCQTETFATRDAYRAAGLRLADNLALPEDHLGVTLEFLAHLIEGNQKEQALAFLHEHLLSWWPRAKTTLESLSKSQEILPILQATDALFGTVETWLQEEP